MMATLAACLVVLPAFGQPAEEAAAAASPPAQTNWIGIGTSLLGGLVQLILGITLAVSSISLGIRILGRTLPKVKIMEELNNKNVAVGLMTAGVVVAYTKVIATGVKQMGDSIAVSPSAGAFIGGLINVLIGLSVASIGVTWAFQALDKILQSMDKLANGSKLDIDVEINKGNIAVGLFLFGVLYGVSEMISAAVQGIGPGLANALSALIPF
jgi:uncharacterized membrane protein YjfL (UPF0719 family)